ncbi:MAG: prepilin-type N-terminal cleavage/methylation domain-containing protein [Heliobacteriaceae bacterium]|jgi:prepilin-type N-terminal cleavage/methylation domain-containing protein|nr:prepilin-type N-terminal cleavage/methylation domain-containing protein [Heliobacteriaceae bacterium]
MKAKEAFTLAEVLITLGIIGIIASLTMPALIANHQKIETVTKLKKFYTNINQAVRLSEAENGPASEWTYPVTIDSYSQIKTFYDDYLAKYLSAANVEQCSFNSDCVCVHFSDGTVATLRSISGIDIIFYTKTKYFASVSDYSVRSPRYSFLFHLNKLDNSANTKYLVEPYTFYWDGTREDLITGANYQAGRYGCHKDSITYGYCTKLIQYDGWEIKGDYPW